MSKDNYWQAAKRWAIFFLICCVGFFHFMVISPALWSHNSSAAFHMWVFSWVVVIIAVVMAFLSAADNK